MPNSTNIHKLRFLGSAVCAIALSTLLPFSSAYAATPSPDIPLSCTPTDTSGVVPDGLPDFTFPQGYWAASYFQGANNNNNAAGNEAFQGEAFWGVGENPVRITLNGSASLGRWSTTETPTSPLLPHPSYVGSVWTDSNPRYQIDYRSQVQIDGEIRIGGDPGDVVDDTIEIYVNGVRQYAYFPGGGAPDPRPTDIVAAVVPVLAGDEVMIRFINLGYIGGMTFEFKAPGLDCSDTPSTYGRPSHITSTASTTYLGATVDTDASDITSAAADADEADDGVTLPTFVQGDNVTIPVAVNQAAANEGYLQGWIDWNGDGDFADAGEQIATDIQSANAGSSTINVAVTVPANATTSPTFARFRWATDAGLDSTTAASDGEVEDYALTIALPPASPDVPLSCTPTDTSGVVPDGLPDFTFPQGYWAASYFQGANNNNNAAGNEAFQGEAFWGVGENPVRITLNGSASLGRWSTTETPTSPLLPHPSYVGSVWTDSNPRYQIDYRSQVQIDGEIRIGGDPGDVVDDTIEIYVNGVRQYAYFPGGGAPDPRPTDIVAAVVPVLAGDEVMIRFINLGYIGGMTFEFKAPGLDCSDTPSTYGRPSHITSTASTTYLGATVDTDASDIASAAADADGADDDGVTLPTLTAGSSVSIPVVVNQTTANTGYLQAWFDWNGDGDFADAGEQVATDIQSATAGSSTINVPITVPANAVTTQTFARFRWATDAGLDSTTAASDGEVEDYALTIAIPPASPDVPFAACQVPNFSGIAPDGLPDLAFPKGYWAASYYEGHEGIAGSGYATGQNGSGGSGTKVFRGEAFWGTGENPVVSASNGANTAYGAWTQNETPTSDGIPHPSYVGTTWTSSGNPFYQTDFRRSIELAGTISVGGTPTSYIDDSIQIFINGTQVYRTYPGGSGSDPNPSPTVRGEINVAAGDEVRITFINLGWIGGYDMSLDVPGVDCSDAPASYGESPHIEDSSLYLGSVNDDETNSILSTNADADGASDDGVTLPTFTQGDNVTIPVAVNQAAANDGYLQGWIDWNGDGDFADAGEQIATDIQSANAGSSTINVTVAVPAIATTSPTFARFRWATDAGLDSTTAASDGEVEDYALTIAIPPASPDVPFAACQVADFSGVSPDGLPDLTFPKGYWAASYNEGYSGTPGSPYATPASSSGGTGTAVYHGEAFWGTGENPVTITTNGTASLNRWSTNETPTDPLQPPGYVGTNWSGTNPRYQIDYRRTIELPGTFSFGLGSDEVVDDILDVYINGVRVYAYWPSGGAPNARPGQGVGAAIPVDTGDEVLIRFINLGFIGGLTFHLDVPGVDCSDAPGSYLDTSHVEHFGSEVYLGASLDDETSSILSVDATGDGADDDGVTFPTLAVGNSASIPVVVNQAAANDGYLQGWIDWNGDGDFADAGEQIATDIQSATAGSSTINVPVIVPATATTNETFARFRWSTDAGLDGTTAASDGEVEDYAITIIELDYGDAPGYADAVHVINGTTYLGSMPDADSGTLTTNGDASDDRFDDGVRRNGTTLQDQTLNSSTPATLSVTTTGTGRLQGWIDWDGDGVFGNNPNEQVVSETTSASGTRTVTVVPPTGLTPGISYARFRYSTDTAAANSTGTASDGEVEDYRIALTQGYNVSGRVFNDTNVNSSNDSTEAGIASVTVVLYDSINATCISTQTNANGNYAFTSVVPSDYQVYEAAGETAPVPQSCNPANATDPSGYLSTVNNTSAAFTISNSDLGGINFGDIQPPVFELDNEQTILPNSAALHPHVFTAQSDGSVSFSIVSENVNPASLDWGIQLLLDANCDGQLNSANGDSALPASINVSAGQQICVLAKVISPSNASAGAMHVIDIQSDFAYGDGSLGIANDAQTHQDITRSLAGTTTAPPVAPVVDPVGAPDPVRGEGKLALVKSVWNVTRNIDGSVALPGEKLRYTISYQNIGNGPLNELVINDNVPAFTAVVQGSMLCTDTPPELPACATNENPDGSLSWEWTVNDELSPGSSGSVSYAVTIE